MNVCAWKCTPTTGKKKKQWEKITLDKDYLPNVNIGHSNCHNGEDMKGGRFVLMIQNLFVFIIGMQQK